MRNRKAIRVPSPAKRGPEGPKTTRPEAKLRREAVPTAVTRPPGKMKLDALPDRIDIRDWIYRPRLAPLPDQIVNCDSVPFILDQGQEGACTGFALAAGINFLLAARNIRRAVSPRMLYEMARRYDNWPGEDYEGSSARGAMKGWIAHGVCAQEKWPHHLVGFENFDEERAENASLTPGGAYYRVKHREIRDMHSALAETGILYTTLMVHEGWMEPDGPGLELTYVENGNLRKRTLPTIQRKGRATAGHAIAIVGYTHDGFIIQNSWGPDWGNGGFALLPYEDYMLHATDVWVAQLGVHINVRAWERTGVDTAGIARATRAIPLSELRPYVVDAGNNGELSDSGEYWTTEKDLERLFSEMIPKATAGWEKLRVMLYLHGGLNDEAAVARRIIAFRDVFQANKIYPLHIMWESGLTESLNGIVRDLFTDVDERTGNWLDTFREGLIEAKDRTLELTAAAPGRVLWGEMKENARLASDHPDDLGAMQLLVKHIRAAMKGLDEAVKKKWELHLVGHSAGSIFAAHALKHLLDLVVTFKTLQFMAPAITVGEFKRLILPPIKKGQCPHPTMYLLSDEGERDDTVGPYGKSLLYLVSNAFEKGRGIPLLGMERFVRIDKPRGREEADPEIDALFRKPVDGRPSLVIAGQHQGAASTSSSDSHGGFDNDPDTLNSLMRRMLDLKDDQKLSREFTVRDLQY